MRAEPISETPTDDLVRAARGGDEGAWRELVDRLTPRVFAFVRSKVGAAELAEELTQTTFVKVARQFARTDSAGYEERGVFEAWLFRIAINSVRDEARSRKRRAEVPAEAASPEATADRLRPDAALAAMREAIASLGPADREMIDLRHQGGLSFTQIAATLGKPLGTVLARHHRALKKLRAALEARGIDAGELAG
ncbi:MAG: sigma-70 family RNA polymerase sigma factor [Planctomycetota bacterium]